MTYCTSTLLCRVDAQRAMTPREIKERSGSHGLQRECPMTKEEFEKCWAINAGMTVEHVRECGMTVVPCACGESGCRGWQIVVDLSGPDGPAMIDARRALQAQGKWGQDPWGAWGQLSAENKWG